MRSVPTGSATARTASRAASTLSSPGAVGARHVPGSGTAASSGGGWRPCPTARRPPATTATTSDDDDDRRPRRPSRSRPRTEREELDEAVRRRVEQVRPGGKKTSWKSSKSWSKAKSPTTPTTTTPIDQTDRAAANRPPRRARDPRAGSRRPARRPRSRRGPTARGRRTGRRPCGPARASLRTGGRSTWTVEIATEHEVGQDRVGGDPQLLGVKPVQAAAWARPCSKATHCGLRNGRIVTATMTIAVARPVRTDAARPPRSFTGSS